MQPERIAPLRRCRHCDDPVGIVCGEYVHVNGLYVCKGKGSGKVAS